MEKYAAYNIDQLHFTMLDTYELFLSKKKYSNNILLSNHKIRIFVKMCQIAVWLAGIILEQSLPLRPLGVIIEFWDLWLAWDANKFTTDEMLK